MVGQVLGMFFTLLNSTVDVCATSVVYNIKTKEPHANLNLGAEMKISTPKMENWEPKWKIGSQTEITLQIFASRIQNEKLEPQNGNLGAKLKKWERKWKTRTPK